MVLPPPPCFHCTLQNGIFISKEDDHVHHLIDLEDRFIDRICPLNFQCVGHQQITSKFGGLELGCCFPCSPEQSCPEGTVSMSHPFTDNICPDGYLCHNTNPSLERCSVGEICRRNNKLDCATIQEEASSYGVGMILDGTYCDGMAFMSNCPTGFYCPTATQKIICPSSYFCPLKTKIPEISCQKCKEGATERFRNDSLNMFLFLAFILALISFFYIVKTKFNFIAPTIGAHRTDEERQTRTSSSQSLHDSEKEHSLSVAMEYKNLSVVRGGVRILKNVNGTIRPKRLCALLGQSGSGKSTLLSILASRGVYCADISGKIIVNGRTFKGCQWNSSENNNYKSFIGYVPQEDDAVYSELTVWENLFWAGRLQLSRGSNIDDIKDLTKHIIQSLDLEHVQHIQVRDGISGGERRRVSIGISLMGKPKVLLCDEPTSSLDASSGLAIIELLKNLANGNMTILCSIHQPRQNIFNLFDDLILLGKGGNIIFSGKANEAMGYFKTLGYQPGDYGVNPADYLLDLVTGRGFDDTEKTVLRRNLSNSWSEYDERNNMSIHGSVTTSPNNPCAIQPDGIKSLPRPLPTTQFLLQCRRSFLLLHRNSKEKLIDTFVLILASIVMTSVEGVAPLVEESVHYPLSFDDISSFNLPFEQMMQFAINPVFGMKHFAVKISAITGVLTALAASRTISVRKSQVHREIANGYNISSYFLAVNVISSLEHGLQMILAGAISYWILQPLQPIFSYTSNFFMLGFVMQGWGQLFALFVPLENLTLVSGAILLCLNLLFSGVTKPTTFHDIYNDPKLAIIAGFLSPTRFFVETLLVSELRCFPEQYGFTKPPDAGVEFTALDKLSLAINDKNSRLRDCNGWFANTPILFVIGLMLRVLSLLMIHWSYRRSTLFGQKKSFYIHQFSLLLSLLGLIVLAKYMIST